MGVKALAEQVFLRDKARDRTGTSENNLVPKPVPAGGSPGTGFGTNPTPRFRSESELRMKPAEAPPLHRTDNPPPETWTVADWRSAYGERAAIFQYDAERTRADAERMAWHYVASIWYRRHGVRVPADRCAGMRQGNLGRRCVVAARWRARPCRSRIWLHHRVWPALEGFSGHGTRCGWDSSTAA